MADQDRQPPAHLELTREPFSQAIEDDMFFRESSRVQLLSTLAQNVREDDVLLLATGERGVGKTSLLRQFLSMRDPAWHVSVLAAHEFLDGAELLAEICQDFGIEVFADDYATRLEKLCEELSGLRDEDAFVLLIVDDFHTLQDSALRALLELYDRKGDRGRLLRIMLFGESLPPALAPGSSMAPLARAVTHSVEVSAFSEEQTTRYILHRLAAAGLKREMPFTQAQLKDIYTLSDGVAAEINLVAGPMLEEAELPPVTPPAAAEPAAALPARRNTSSLLAITAVGVVIVVAAIAFMGSDEEPSVSSEEVQPPAETAVVEQPVESAEAPTASEREPEPGPEPETMAVPAAVPMQSDLAQSPRVAPAPDAAPEPEPEAMADTEQPQATAVVTLPEPTPEPSPDTGTPEEIEAPAQTPTAAGPAGVTPTVEPAAAPDETPMMAARETQPAPEAVPDTAPSSESAAAAPAPSVAPPETVPEAVPEPTIGPTGATAPGPHREAWLLAQDPSHYTIMLMGSRSENTVKKYIDGNDLADKVSYFRTEWQGAPWFALLYGVYPDRSAATAASRGLARLPHIDAPWIRTLDSVHKDIAKVR